LTVGQLVFFDTGRSDLLRLDHFDIVHPFTRLREDLERLGHASWMVECVARLTAEHDPHPALYALLIRALRAAEDAQRPGQIAVGFGIRCIDLLRHRPRLDACLGCGRRYPFTPAYLDASAGGLVCAACEGEAASPLPISTAAVQAFERVADGMATAKALGRTEGELASVVDGYVSRLIGHPTRTPRFLREVRRLPGAPGGYQA
jgi:DNA repair protein RecO (recombination protein O)